MTAPGTPTPEGAGGVPWRKALEQALSTSRIRFDEPLHPFTTLRIGGPADCLVDLESEADLAAALAVARDHQLPCHVLGKGSNVLVRDEGVRGLVLRMGAAFKRVEPLRHPGKEDGRVKAGAGTANAAFVEACRGFGLGGMEFLVAVPGTIGGAIAMNAGAHDGDTAAFLESVRYHDPEQGVLERPASDFKFGYRHSPLRANEGPLVLAGTFRLRPLEDTAMRERQRNITQWRREHQPRDFPNCGSVFKNPPGGHAARLIDEAGLKGHTIGGAQVSEKHANFIVNRNQARAEHVLALVDFIHETVYARTGTRLDLEMQIFPLQ